MEEFLSFRKMITPVLIQVIFWISSAFAVIGLLTSGFSQGGAAILFALIIIPVAVLMIRVYCEVLIVLFRIYETLQQIRGPQGPAGFPVTTEPPPYATPYSAPPPPPQQPR